MKFVGAFCQSNVGDVSPNVVGAFCQSNVFGDVSPNMVGAFCRDSDFNHSSCHGNDQLCVGRGPRIVEDPNVVSSIHIFPIT
ncbi:hypothetical protein HAX54_034323 [Datura stramonium]|uniref:Neutral/alkaline non-lysosomal ceramidase N-terminal domain-containing protein n=1 Tax=Datura stramonium TaxID=4076 RepID=A0ABS8SEA8_DATST|nr:hypothetical protein [Datura stramonium]